MFVYKRNNLSLGCILGLAQTRTVDAKKPFGGHWMYGQPLGNVESAIPPTILIGSCQEYVVSWQFVKNANA